MTTIIELIQKTLTKEGHNYEKYIDELGQVKAYEKRIRGDKFGLNDHIRGLVLALLSAQRPWRPIANNLDVLSEIFLGYDFELLLKANTKEIYDKILMQKLGNRSLKAQIRSLQYNIEILRAIENEYGSNDRFVESESAEAIAKQLSDSYSKYKIKQLGFTLALEYLKNVGIRTSKPDTHIMRICGHERLGFFQPEDNEEAATIKFQAICLKYGYNPTYIDNLIWLFGAKGYGEICNDFPKCYCCLLRENKMCNFDKKHKTIGNMHC